MLRFDNIHEIRNEVEKLFVELSQPEAFSRGKGGRVCGRKGSLFIAGLGFYVQRPKIDLQRCHGNGRISQRRCADRDEGLSFKLEYMFRKRRIYRRFEFLFIFFSHYIRVNAIFYFSASDAKELAAKNTFP